ncbi:50S ribosomal protein L25 [Deinococcus yavapaiensis]|uniref:Large ribosomal subunit protein bL25 n=1 Tax=Deinococcus yavapaiensis KR-236 TaxID=694435 RepID=A0A318S5P8_9DEIO|nr:50S ribosomal protein L25 [Deinococcus yavapaiensis]PYE51133.1 LSU ribosomal protein L25P [Deinococcus yavapaiensis KR-236]
MELKAIPRSHKDKLPQGYIPAVAYNKERSVPIAIEARAFDVVFRSQSTHGLVELTLEGQEPLPAIVKSVQMDKRKRTVAHADFYLATYGQEIEARVPVHTGGKPRGVTDQGGILDVLVHNLAIIAPGPRRIPDEIVVDVTSLGIGDVIRAGDLQLPEGCRIAIDADVAILAVVQPQKMVSAEEVDLGDAVEGGGDA